MKVWEHLLEKMFIPDDGFVIEQLKKNGERTKKEMKVHFEEGDFSIADLKRFLPAMDAATIKTNNIDEFLEKDIRGFDAKIILGGKR